MTIQKDKDARPCPKSDSNLRSQWTSGPRPRVPRTRSWEGAVTETEMQGPYPRFSFGKGMN